MSKSEVSLKDIAKKANTSVATVSRALNEKPGVSEKLRNKIIDVANDMGYVPNVMAREIRADARNILALFPIKDYDSKFYTDLLWQGYQKGKSEFNMYEVNYYELYLEETDVNRYNELVTKMLQGFIDKGIKFDGLIIYQAGFSDLLFSKINELKEEGIPVIALHKSMEQLKFTSLITDDAYTIGKLAAEMLYKYDKNQKQILLLEFSLDEFNNKDETSQGFQDTITKLCPDVIIKKIDQFSPDLLDYSTNILNDKNTTGLFGTTARTGIFLSKLVEMNNWKDRFFLIATGLNEISKQALTNGSVKCIIDNYPEKEGVEALRELFNIMVYKKDPVKLKKVPMRIVFESNLASIDEN